MKAKKNLNSLEEAWNEIHSLEQQNHLLESQLRTKEEALDKALGEVGRLEEALEFYADPETYHGCSFLFDRPTGGFDEDLSEDHGNWKYEYAKPGKLARATLAGPSPDEKEEG